MTAETGALEEMLLLTRGVLCPDLLAVDTLHGKTLETRKRVCMSVLKTSGGGLKYYPDTGNTDSHTLSSSLARNSTNAAWTSWSTVRPMISPGYTTDL